MPDGQAPEAGAAFLTWNTLPSILPDRSLCETTTPRFVFLRKHLHPLVRRLDEHRPAQAGAVSSDDPKSTSPALYGLGSTISFLRIAKSLTINFFECDTHHVTGESYVGLSGAAQGDLDRSNLGP
jgi:hypothetical protein